MSIVAVLLLLCSALLHAGWNLISKHEYPTTTFFLVSLLPALFPLGLFLIFSFETFTQIPLSVWQILFFCGFFQLLYFTALAGAYRTGHVSIAYPIARSVPIILVALISIFVRGNDQLSWLALLGMGLIMVGCLMLPMQAFRRFCTTHYFIRSTLFALLASIGITGYSVMDDMALKILRQSTVISVSNFWITFIYQSLEFSSALLWIILFLVFRRVPIMDIIRTLRNKTWGTISVGVIMIFSSLLILLSLAYVKDVSYTVAFRQVSIVIGLLFAVVFLKEPATIPKITGTLVVFAGLILVALG